MSDFCKRHKVDHYGTDCSACFAMYKKQNAALKEKLVRASIKFMRARDGLELCLDYMKCSPVVDKQAVMIIEEHAREALKELGGTV